MTIANDARLSDAEKVARQEAVDKKKAEAALLRKDFNEVFSGAAGIRVLKWIHDQCGVNQYLVSVDPTTTKILTENIIYNASRQALYVSMRKLLNRSILISVENGGPESDGSELFS